MNLSKVKSSISNLELSAKRKLGSVQLIAVSKVQPNEKIKVVLEEVKEFLGKIEFKKLWVNGLVSETIMIILSFI